MDENTNTVDATAVLGGVNAETTENTVTATAPVATTPGKAARKRANAKAAGEAKEKREYTARGTTYHCKRVVLEADGTVAGRGRPSIDSKGRTVVYIPKDAEYDKSIYGVGVPYRTPKKDENGNKGPEIYPPFKRIAKNSVKWVYDDGVNPTVKKTKTKAKSKVKAKVKAKGKGKGKKTKTVNVPVEVPANVEAPTVETVATVESSAVTA
jgi:hypothetical protein